MRRRNAALVVVAGAAGAIAVGSGLTAWAGWSVATTSGLVAARGDVLPAVGRPSAVLEAAAPAVPKVTWAGVRYPSGQPVGGYAVTRHVGGARTEVCRVPATTLACSDAAVEAGSAVTYTVRAVAGDRWVGPSSPISDLLLLPGAAAPSSLAAGRPVAGGTGEGGNTGDGTGSVGDGTTGPGAGGASASGTRPGGVRTGTGPGTGGTGDAGPGGAGDADAGADPAGKGGSTPGGAGTAAPTGTPEPKPDAGTTPTVPVPTVTSHNGSGAGATE